MKYDVIIIGAGPSGIFCAYELLKEKPDLKVLMIEKRTFDREPSVSKEKNEKMRELQTVLTRSQQDLPEQAHFPTESFLFPRMSVEICRRFLGYEKTVELIHESDQIYLDFGADKNVYGVDKEKRDP